MNQAGMNNDTRDSLSAGIDGELPKEQLRFLLRRLDHDEPLQQQWIRYHMIRDSLRRQLPAAATTEFATRVMLAIEQESAAAGSVRSRYWLRWSTGGVIAASVAAAALMIGQPTGGAGRLVASTGSGQQTSAPAMAQAAGKTSSPAVVPPWLSGNSAELLSQQASATLGSPFAASQPAYARRPSTYPMHTYRTLDNKDGSYLLLLDPGQHVGPERARQSAAAQ